MVVNSAITGREATATFRDGIDDPLKTGAAQIDCLRRLQVLDLHTTGCRYLIGQLHAICEGEQHPQLRGVVLLSNYGGHILTTIAIKVAWEAEVEFIDGESRRCCISNPGASRMPLKLCGWQALVWKFSETLLNPLQNASTWQTQDAGGAIVLILQGISPKQCAVFAS